MKTVVVTVKKFVAYTTFRKRPIEPSAECLGFQDEFIDEFCDTSF